MAIYCFLILLFYGFDMFSPSKKVFNFFFFLTPRSVDNRFEVKLASWQVLAMLATCTIYGLLISAVNQSTTEAPDALRLDLAFSVCGSEHQ